MRELTAGLVSLAIGIAASEARADGGGWALQEDGTWTEEASAPDVPASEERERDGGLRLPPSASRTDPPREMPREDPPMQSVAAFAGGIVLTAVGGSVLVTAALASLPIGYEGNGGEPTAELVTIGALGAAAAAGGVGLLLWGRAPDSRHHGALSVGPQGVHLGGRFW